MNTGIFLEQPKHMSPDDAQEYFANMLDQIREYDPDEIIAVNRSGFSYAMWAAQVLKKPLGAYWHDRKILVSQGSRLVFVDDNLLQGSTYLKTGEFMKAFPNINWKWAVLFCDYNTPTHIQQEIIKGVALPYFALDPIWGSMKTNSGHNSHFRNQGK